MQKRKRQPPSYRPRKGYDQAIVTLTDSVTGYRKDYWLGSYGSPESRELYHRVLAQWESGRRRLPVTLDDKPADIAQVSVVEVINAYWKWATRQYGHSELGCLRVVIRLLRTMFGSTPAADFGPNRLRLLRDQMILGDENATSDTGCGATAVVDMGAYEFPGTPLPCLRPGDVSGDGTVNVLDLIDLLLAFGASCEVECCLADFDLDGTVNVLDLIELLLAFGSACP